MAVTFSSSLPGISDMPDPVQDALRRGAIKNVAPPRRVATENVAAFPTEMSGFDPKFESYASAFQPPVLESGGGIRVSPVPVAEAKAERDYTPPQDIPLPEMPDYDAMIGDPSRKLSETQAEYEQFLGEKEADTAKRQATQARRKLTAAQRYAEDIQAEEIRKERDAFEAQLAKPFLPTQQNFSDLATIYSLVGVLGFAIGAGGKGNALQAMSAMNGMIEGYREGRIDLYEKEKDAFEYNAKALKTKVDSLNNKIKEIAELAKVDYERADMEADVMFAEEGATFLKNYKDKVGLVGTIKMLQEKVKAGEKLFEFMTKERSRVEEINKKARDKFEENVRNIEARQEQAAQMAEVRRDLAAQQIESRELIAGQQDTLRRELAAQQDAQRRELAAAEDRRLRELQAEREREAAARQREREQDRAREAQKDRDFKAEQNRRDREFKLLIENMRGDRQREKTGTKLDKIPVKDRDAYQLREMTIPALQEGIATLDRLQKEGKWTKMTTLLAIPGRGNEAAELAFKDDPGALSLIRTFARFRSAEFETAGKALTAREDQILRPLYRADLRTYEGIRNAMSEGLNEMKSQKRALENQFPSLARRAAGEVDIAEPKTQKDFDALKSGALYIDPDDGRTYRKK